MKNLKKFFKIVVTVASLLFMLYCFGNIQKGIEMFYSFIGALIAMCILYWQASTAGWLYDCFYEEEE